MKLLVTENGMQMPKSIEFFLHDNKTLFTEKKEQTSFFALTDKEKSDLLIASDALAAQSTFAEKKDLEMICQLFYSGKLLNKPFRFYVWGMIQHLNIWFNPALSIAEREKMYGFDDFRAFSHAVLHFIEQGRLFNIEPLKSSEKILDCITDKTTYETEFFSRHIHRPFPILHNKDATLFFTEESTPAKVRRAIKILSRA